MKPDELRALIRILEESGVDEIEIRRWGKTVRIARNAPGSASAAAPAAPAAPAPAPAAPPAPVVEAGPAYHPVPSPMVGTFYRAPSPEAPAFVEVGSTVRVGQTLCILEAMKLMNELQSEVAGVVRRIAVENGAPVEYGQVLFEIEV